MIYQNIQKYIIVTVFKNHIRFLEYIVINDKNKNYYVVVTQYHRPTKPYAPINYHSF